LFCSEKVLMKKVLMKKVLMKKVLMKKVLMKLSQQTADSRQQTADSRQQTADSRQQTADSRQQTADSRQHRYYLSRGISFIIVTIRLIFIIGIKGSAIITIYTIEKSISYYSINIR